MTYEPKQKNKAPEMTILALFLCATVCVAFSSWDEVGGRGILQAIALVMFCMMIFVLVRYKFTRIRYTVRLKTEKKGYGKEDDEEEYETASANGAKGAERSVKSIAPEKLELVIEKAQGSSLFVAECIVALDEITMCKQCQYDKAQRKKLKKEAGKGITYKYIKNMIGAEQWIMTVKTAHGNAKIIFEPGDEMGEYLSAVAGYNLRQDDPKRR